MDNKEFSKQLKARTKKFAIQIFILSASLPLTPESKADFFHKIKLCESESGETKYWSEIIDELKKVEDQTMLMINTGANELLEIFTSIGKDLKLKSGQHPTPAAPGNPNAKLLKRWI
jgi:hypothetical protein